MKKLLFFLIVLVTYHLSYTDLLSSTICQNDTIVYLSIHDRRQAPESPPEGWCGETSIQMAALYYGAFIPQRIIHDLPNPVHPDLYSNDLPVALSRIGLQYSMYSNASSKTVADYIEWIKDQLDQHYPVLIGCKIYPTYHPEWFLDHFMIAVGYTQDKLIYNTTWGYQEAKSFGTLSTIQNGISFENQQRYYYGISIKGFKSSVYGLPLNVFPLRETIDSMLVQIHLDSLTENYEYQLLQFDDINQSKQPFSSTRAVQVQTFGANKSYHEISTQIPIESASIFRCIAVTQSSINGETGIHRKPDGFVLYDNYPNPFNPSTRIRYALGKPSQVTLLIYNTLGQKIKTLVNSYQNAGEHSIVWDATDENSDAVHSGIYFYRLETGSSNINKKMILLR